MTHFKAQNASGETSKELRPTRLAVYVRLSEGDYQSLASDAVMFGKSVPDMLREGYFRRGGGITVLMPSADQKALMAELARVGNNVNQIARQLNQGSRGTFSSELRHVQEELTLLTCLVGNAVRGIKPKVGKADCGDR